MRFPTTLRRRRRRRNPRDLTGERVNAIESGRVNIAHAEEKLPDGSFKKYKITRRRYYADSGIKHFNQLSDKWLKPLENTECSKRNPASTTRRRQAWRSSTRASRPTFLRTPSAGISLHEEAGPAAFHRSREETQGARRVFQSMHKNGERKPVVVYGNFPCNGRGLPSVPTNKTKKPCGKYFETFEVHEFRTSVVCPVWDQVVFQFISIQFNSYFQQFD